MFSDENLVAYYKLPDFDMKNLTAHCLIKNEERFIWFSVMSVIHHVDKVMIWDTGSTDDTKQICLGLKKVYPDKIELKDVGECDGKRHTELRNEMIKETTTDWIMILDGDEIWPGKALIEAQKIRETTHFTNCIYSYFRLSFGNLFREARRKIDWRTMRFFKKGFKFEGAFERDESFTDGEEIEGTLKERFIHATHLSRSRVKTDYSSGGTRGSKEREGWFYSLFSKRIKDTDMPEIILYDLDCTTFNL